MAEKYRFMDAVQDEFGVYDREYNAQEFTDYFKALVTTGVMKGAGNQLAVSANGSSMITKVDTGIAFILGRYYENDSFKELTHDTETLGNSRIDRIVVRMDLSTEARYVKSFIKKGVPSTNPVPPALTQTANLYEISLAQVRIVGGQTFIATNAVTDERGKDVICPWASSNILPSYDDNALATHLDEIATTEKLGHIKPDGTTIKVDPVTGVATVISGGNAPFCKMGLTSNQSIASYSLYPVPYTKVINNDFDMWSATTNQSRITCKKDGKYLIVASVLFGAEGSGNKESYIAVNGVTVGMVNINSAVTPTGQVVSSVVNMTVGDYVELKLFQGTGAALTLNKDTSLSVMKVSD